MYCCPETKSKVRPKKKKIRPRRAPDPPAKERERLYEKRVHAEQRRVCVDTWTNRLVLRKIPAVRERPAEKWPGQGRTSRTGDAASELAYNHSIQSLRMHQKQSQTHCKNKSEWLLSPINRCNNRHQMTIATGSVA